MSAKVNFKKLPTKNGPVVKNPTKAIAGEVIALGDDLIIVRNANGGIEEVSLEKGSAIKVKDLVTFSEHGVLTDHRREETKRAATTAPEPKKQGSARCPVNA